jgi:hypothetical protein
MKTKIQKMALAGMFILGSMATAQAELVKTDWKTQGDGLATLDSETGIEWLDLTQTKNFSLNQMDDMLANGDQFAGWRMPTQAEVAGLFFRIFSGNFSSGANSVSSAEIDRFYDHFGYTSNVSEGADLNRGYGLYRRDDNSQPRMMGVRGASTAYINYDHSAYSQNYSSELYAVWLVSDGGVTRSSKINPSLNANNPNAPAVNVPVAGFGVLALLGLFAMARRKRARA